MERVTSKNLFAYQPCGIVDQDLLQAETQMRNLFLSDPEMKYIFDPVDPVTCDVDVDKMADLLRRNMPKFEEYLNETFNSSVEECVHSEFKVPLSDDNDYEVPVLVHTPKSISGNEGKAAIVYAHGGGWLAGGAHLFKAPVSYVAAEVGVVIFNVDYRLAPETKCPNNALDFYHALKYIISNAESFGVDSSKVAIAGDSGGGYICGAAMVLLAQRKESHLVKLAILGTPLLSDYCFTDISSMTKEERYSAHYIRKMWVCLADDFNAQRDDPLLFPAKASDSIIENMPPTVIWEGEFDNFITEVTRFAHRLRTAGRLLEFRVDPGKTHAASQIPKTKGLASSLQDYKLTIREYLM